MLRLHGRILGTCAAVLFLFACTSPIEPIGNGDSRVGRNGLVRFEGGGGCSDSTTFALGATQTLTIEPVDEGSVLPDGLSARSSAQDTIELGSFTDNRHLTLTAKKIGTADIQLIKDDNIYDSLTFGVEKATAVIHSAPDAGFTGASVFIKIEEVHGACGSDCPLIGGSFLLWESGAGQDLSVLRDTEERVAYFSSSQTGPLTIIGKEPASGNILIDHTITLIDPAETESIQLTVSIFTEDELVEVPGSDLVLPLGSLFIVSAHAITSSKDQIPIAGPDINWFFEGDNTVAKRLSDTEDLPEGGVFEVTGAGTVTLNATLDFLESSISASVTLTVEEK